MTGPAFGAGGPPVGRSPKSVWYVLAGSFVLHAALMPAPGYERDLYWFGTWMRVAVEHGVAHVAEQVWCDYPPGYLYVLKAIGLIWTLVTGTPVPPDGTLALRLLVKSVPVLADLAGAWLLYRLARTALPARSALVVLAAYAFNPAMLFNSAFWGQADSLTSLLLLASVFWLQRLRFATAYAFIAASILVKVQSVVVAPVLLLATWRIAGFRALLDGSRGAAATALVLLLPFFWADQMDSVLATVFGSVGRYPYASLEAHNVWWLVAGADARISDAMRVGNALLSYRALGLLMFAASMTLILWRLWRDRRLPVAVAIHEACALALIAFYLFPTEMHERYVVPAIVFVAGICIWRPACWWFYVPLSFAVTASLASSLNVAYPDALGAAAGVFRPDRGETFLIAAVIVFVFIVLLLWTDDRRFRWGIVASVAVFAALVTSAVVAPLRSNERLCSWEPVRQEQSWGRLHRERTVDGNRLSVFGFIFRHGIGTHATSTLTYHLNGAFRFFDTAFGIDDEANRGNRIRFRVLADGSLLYDSGDLSGRTFPRHLRVPVHGAEFLTLEVLDGGDGIDFDHADWLEPVLVR